jgi:hypothetical protein
VSAPTDLVSGLLSAIEQREKLATGAGSRSWHVEHNGRVNDEGDIVDCEPGCDCCRVDGDDITIYDEGGHDGHQAAHIVANDPHSVLRLCRAHRKIVEDYRRTKMLLAEANQRVLQQVVDGLVSTRQEQRDFDSLHVEEAVLREVIEGLAEGYGLTTEEDD